MLCRTTVYTESELLQREEIVAHFQPHQQVVVCEQCEITESHFSTEWRKEELERINSTLSGAERKAALCVLLEQETQLVASIGRHKLDAESENRSNKIQGQW